MNPVPRPHQQRNPLAAAHHSRWYDDEAGPLVRPYAMTRGRTRPSGQEFDLIALVVSEVPDPAGFPDAPDLPVGPEQARILGLCRGGGLPVAEIAAGLDLPLGVVRVLLGDLLAAGYIRVGRPVPPALLPDERILQEVVHGLRAL
ncbi:DUF742 domain-containing protein [Streptomyces sp. CB01881]|nr:DUF742 domain-containing protein [Streptomyces sp. CB01881]TYC77465.1 DUF742 domain-containing protein [Streptomyces sp. CB01881]